MKKEVAIYISSYDGCSDIWDNFFKIFDKYWKNCTYNIYLVNNEKQYKYNGVTTLNTGPEVNWFNRTIKSLEKINEEYILFLLEDYFFSKEINEKDIEEIINFMQKNNVYYYQLSKRCNSNKDIRIVATTESGSYPISLQPAIWRKDDLFKILKEINGETPWDFEHYFKQKYSGKSGEIEGAYYDVRDILGYKNGVLRGKWIRSTLKFYDKKGINIELGNRKKLPILTEIKFGFAGFCNRYLPKKLKIFIKTTFNKLKINYFK